MPGIVVGVDGSAGSREALEWAVKHAALEHAALTVLAVHEVAASAWTGNPIVLPEDRTEEEHAKQATQELVNKMVSDLGGASPASVIFVRTNDSRCRWLKRCNSARPRSLIGRL